MAIVTVCVVMVQAGADEPGGVGLHLPADGPLPQPVRHPQGNAGLSASRVPILVPCGRAHVWQGPGPEPPHLLHLLPHCHVAQRQVSSPPSPLCPLVVVFTVLLWSLSCFVVFVMFCGLCHVVVFVMLLLSLLCYCGFCHVVVVFAVLLWSLPCCCGLCHVVVFVMLFWLCCHVVVVFAMLLWSLSYCGFCHVVLTLLSCCGLCHVVYFVMLWSLSYCCGLLGESQHSSPFRACTCQTEAKRPCFHTRCFVLVKRMLCTCQTEAKWTFFMPGACLA